MTRDDENTAYRVLVLEKEQERTRDRLHKIETRLATLELTTVKRNGPIIAEIHEFERKVNDLATLDEIRSALNNRTVTLGTKAWAVLLALAIFGLSVYNTFFH